MQQTSSLSALSSLVNNTAAATPFKSHQALSSANYSANKKSISLSARYTHLKTPDKSAKYQLPTKNMINKSTHLAPPQEPTVPIANHSTSRNNQSIVESQPQNISILTSSTNNNSTVMFHKNQKH